MVRCLRDGECVAFVGAGFSKPAGFPDYVNILRLAMDHQKAKTVLSDEVAAVFRYRLGSLGLSQRELDPIQKELSTALGKELISNIFAEILFGARLEDGGLMMLQLSALRSIPFAAVVTSNWDDLLERFVCNGEGGGKLPRTLEGYSALLSAGLPAREGSAPLLKFQGDPGDPSTFVLDEEDYQVLLSDAAYMTFWRQLFATRVLFFIGASVSGGYMNDILRAAWRARCAESCGVGVNATGPESSSYPQPLGYIILNDVGADEIKQWLSEYGLCVLPYDSRATKWQGNRLYLEALARACAGVEASRDAVN